MLRENRIVLPEPRPTREIMCEGRASHHCSDLRNSCLATAGTIGDGPDPDRKDTRRGNDMDRRTLS